MTYILHPGIVVSRNDGDIHNITAPMLAYLYRVPPGARTIVAHRGSLMGLRGRPGDVHLFPDQTGRYVMPEPVR